MSLEKIVFPLTFGLCLFEGYNSLAEDPSKRPKINFSNVIANDYVAKPGLIFGSGPVNQTVLSISYEGLLSKKDSLSVFGWSNYDFTDKDVHEIDTGINYSHEFNLLGGKILPRISPQYWFYPSGLILNYDYALDISTSYENNIVDMDLLFRNIFPHENVPNRQIYYLTASKSLKFDQFYAVPNLTVSIINGFPGTNDGIAHVTPKINFKVIGIKPSIFCNLGYQFGFNTRKIKDTPVFGIGFELKF